MMKIKYVMKNQEAHSYLEQLPLMSHDVIVKQQKKNRSLRDIGRETPPCKGAFVEYIKNKGKDQLLSWTLDVKDKILLELEKLCGDDQRYANLLEMERFQYDQKGPMSPIDASAVVSNVVPKLAAEQIVKPKPDALKSLLSYGDTVTDVLTKCSVRNRLDVGSIDFASSWSKLPSSSLRGLPFLEKGKICDESIISTYGNSIDSVLAHFLQLHSLVATSGLRIQGSSKWNQAKVRLINIPHVSYQYLMNGLYKTIAEFIKNKVPTMVGWLSPDERDVKIYDMVERAEKDGYIPISLDFRSFDSRLPFQLRGVISEKVLGIYNDTPVIQQITEKLKELYMNQYLFVPHDNSDLALLWMPKLLMSGIANTQCDGSFCGYVIVAYLLGSLGIAPWEIQSIHLGDDVVMFVPKDTIDQYGYEGFLQKCQDLLTPLSMEIHVKKKYPLPQAIFLQRLYVPSAKICAEYSLVRSVDSLVWSEHFRKPIPGVKNHRALETIGQISTVNNVMQGRGEVSLRSVAHVLIDAWLAVDQPLCRLCQVAAKNYKDKATEYVFNFLVQASGSNEAIISAFKLEQYDDNGLLEKFGATTSASAFPILGLLVERSALQSEVSISLSKYYGVSDVRDGDKGIVSMETNIEDNYTE